VAGYLAWRRRRRRDLALITELHHLRGALRLILPDADWSWLLMITKRIAAAAPRKAPRYNLVTSERLYAVGIDLMDCAVADADAAGRVSKADAFAYRDGLLIALLACFAPRRRTLVAFSIGKHLVKSGTVWALDIPPDDVKGRRPLDYPISPQLSARIDVYLGRFRCRIPGADRHRGLWASNKGRPMSHDRIYAAVCRRTKSALGFAVNPHRFRHAVGSFWSAHDPANVRGVADILGHASFGTTEKHYMMAQSRLSGRVLQQAIDRARKRPSSKRAGKAGQRMR
jgi:integrase